eukprot:NODE_954_length_2919_cov_0.495035.p2 type:complete len:106 gc:universal NODE_954_length_2919_cov_0.495035:1648-1965(+)
MNKIDCTFMNKKAVNYSNKLNMEWEWNNQFDQYRASNFKSHHKNLKHLQVKYDGFLTGTLPRKPIGNQEIKCSYCHRNFEGLDHFGNTCSYTELEYRDSNYFRSD